jgi:hypothetical protein
VSAAVLAFPDPIEKVRRIEHDMKPRLQHVEAMFRQSEIDAATGKPSLSDADCLGLALDVSRHAFATGDALGLCRLVDMVPFWMKVAVYFPRVADGIRKAWETESAA